MTPEELLFSGGTAGRGGGGSGGGGGLEFGRMDGTGPTVDGDAEEEGSGEAESWDVMDLASFLEFAVSASHCLETLHKAGIIHREIRPNSFHVNAHSGVVRFAHFGNRSVSLERLGGPSSLVIEAGELPEWKQRKVKEAMCYLAPEQTGTAETVAEDHRTDLYALGVLFWTLLVGHGRLPFEGSAMELLHSVVQKQPVYVHEVRRDVPEVLSKIVDKVSHASTALHSSYTSSFPSSLRKAPMDGTIPPLG
jgi:serine/threonine protein kinase